MEPIKAKLAEWAEDKGLVKLAAIVLGVLLALIVCLCITIHMRSNIQSKYSNAMRQMQDQTYQRLRTMTELFARVEDPNVDVRYKLIPELKAQYAAADDLNSVLRTSYGDRHAVFSQELDAGFEAAFEQYATAYRNGAATGLAQADMAACMAEAQLLVDAYFAPAEDEADDVVIIDASSGEIQEQ